jgi:hypothetical protein
MPSQEETYGRPQETESPERAEEHRRVVAQIAELEAKKASAARPSIGRIVHYVSRGSADGRFPQTCRAAVVTTVQAGEKYKYVSLAVLNPTGVFFDEGVLFDEAGGPGTWHWPERVE